MIAGPIVATVANIANIAYTNVWNATGVIDIDILSGIPLVVKSFV